MPPTVVRSPHEERLWRQAKRHAAREGHARDWAYIVGLYERLRTHVGGAKAHDAYRKHLHRNPKGRLVLNRTRETEAGVAMNPQDWDGVADVLLRENGVIEPETEEPQGLSAHPQPGYARVYDRRGRPTRRVINPQAHAKPMVFSRRSLRKAQDDDTPHAAHRRQLHTALQRVAAMDSDRAQHRNGIGFSRYDGERGHDLAHRDPDSWTPADVRAAHRLAHRYARQHGMAVPDAPPLPHPRHRAASDGGPGSGAHWVTIHPEAYTHTQEGETTKGRHVLIDGDGRILGGSIPKSAQGKHITNWWKDQGVAEPKLHEHLRGHGVAFTHHEAGHLETGHGYREGKNKWGKPEAEPGHVQVVTGTHTPAGYVGLKSAFADKDRIKALGAKFGPQLGIDAKVWYLPIEKLPKLLKEMPHAEVTAQAVARYDTWAQAHTAQTTPADVKRVEAAAAQQAQQAATAEPFRLPAAMKRDAMAHGDLHGYQKAGVQFLLDQKRAILGHGVGLGKTLESITAALAARERGAGPFLILCPASRKYGWQDEIRKFSNASSVVLDASLSPKQQAARWAQIEAEHPDFIITNYEALQKPDVVERLHALAPNVIADEAHKVKNRKAKTTQGFQAWQDAPYAWLLTATPFPNGQPEETYTMLSHTQPKVVGSWTQFARDHVVFEEVSTPFGRVRKPVALKHVDALREKMARVVQIKTMTDPDVGLALPDRRRIDVRLDLTKEQRRLYDALARNLAQELEGMSDEAFHQATQQVLVKLKRLEQIALDPDLVRPPDERTGQLSPKEEWAVDLIRDHVQDPHNRGIVVFCDMRLPLDKIAEALAKDGIRAAKITGSESASARQETERQFSAGKVSVVLATSAAEEGMNLQHGSHTLIHLDVPWVPKSITQREGRIHRQGQPNPFTTHYHVVQGGTVEERKQGTLHRKAQDIDALLGTHGAEDMAVGRTLSRREILRLLQPETDTALQKSRPARDSRGLFIRRRGAAHRARGMNPNPVGRLKPNRARPSAMPGEIGPGHAHPMQESSMQVMHAISASKRRDPRHPDWGFDPLANAPGNTGTLQPVGTPGIFLYKSDPAIQQAVRDYAALLHEGKTPIVALRLLATRFPWVLAEDSPRARDWWAAVRRADLPRPAMFADLDTEVDPDANSRRRPKRAVFWREDLANLGQGIMAPTGSGGAGR